MKSTTQNSGRDSWIYDNSINVNLPTGLSSREIAERLIQSRVRLEELKKQYAQTVKDSDNQVSLFREIIRVAKAIDLMKDQLVIDGFHFAIDNRDIEHPEAARKRLNWWYWPVGLAVAAGIIGLGAKLFLGAVPGDPGGTQQTTTQAAPSQPTSSFEAGRTDWHKWSEWEHSLDGDKLAGLRFWAEVRGNKPPPSCADGRGAYSSDFRDTCETAKRFLAGVDRARGSDPEYKRGWNAGAKETGDL